MAKENRGGKRVGNGMTVADENEMRKTVKKLADEISDKEGISYTDAMKKAMKQYNNRDNGTQTMSWVDMVKKYDLQNTNRPHITFNKDVFIDDTVYQPRSYNISKGLEQIKQLNEAVVDVDKGMVEKRKKQLQDLGFKIESQTPYSKEDTPWSRVHLFIRKS